MLQTEQRHIPSSSLQLINKDIRMKGLLIFLACSLSFTFACKTDTDCKTGCCIGLGKLKFCRNYLKEGEKCNIGPKIGCGCEPSLTCTKTGAITKRCARIQTECGKPAIKGIRVIAGKTVVRGSWPWQILLKFSGRGTCGGTLIAPQWVVTAAHCVHKREAVPHYFHVVAGEFNRHPSVKEGTEVMATVEKIFKHPKWSTHTLANDITLLKLKKPLKFNNYISPACLPSGPPPVGTDCYITGWGKIQHPGQMTDILQQGKMTVVSNKVCEAKNWAGIHRHVHDCMLCAGDGGKTRMSGCHGDSGGPFVCNLNGHWEVHGAVSHGASTCDSKLAYTVFARVNYFMDWIYDTMSQN